MSRQQTMAPELVAVYTDRFENAPFNKKLGVKVEAFERQHAVLSMEYVPENTTVKDIVHGGAIAALVDCAATAAAWSTIDDPLAYRGITIDLTLNYLASAHACTLMADAKILKQGKTVTYLEVTVTGQNGESVSKSLVTYKLSKIGK